MTTDVLCYYMPPPDLFDLDLIRYTHHQTPFWQLLYISQCPQSYLYTLIPCSSPSVTGTLSKRAWRSLPGAVACPLLG